MATVQVQLDVPDPEQAITRIQGMMIWTCWKCHTINRTRIRHSSQKVTCPQPECRAVSILLLGTMPATRVSSWPRGAQPIITAINHDDWE